MPGAGRRAGRHHDHAAYPVGAAARPGGQVAGRPVPHVGAGQVPAEPGGQVVGPVRVPERPTGLVEDRSAGPPGTRPGPPARPASSSPPMTAAAYGVPEAPETPTTHGSRMPPACLVRRGRRSGTPGPVGRSDMSGGDLRIRADLACCRWRFAPEAARRGGIGDDRRDPPGAACRMSDPARLSPHADGCRSWLARPGCPSSACRWTTPRWTGSPG